MIVHMSMPIVLTREMSPNGGQGGHWGVKSKPRARLREDARRATVSHINGRTPGVSELQHIRDALVMDVQVEWPQRTRGWDEDNIIIALKPVRDGIADALWGGQDHHVRVGTVTQTRGGGGLVFTFRTGADVT